MMDQTETFSTGEGDNWFLRNRAALHDESQDDHVIAMAKRWNEQERVRSACELGCSNGWRLAALIEGLPAIDRLVGSDPSRAAIDDGRMRWPALDLSVGSLDDPNVQGVFDLVIVHFVFSWVARDRLSASVAAVDRLVRDGGAIIIGDFLPDRPCARLYHHRSDTEIYTFKQDYMRCFTGLGIYDELEREIFSHSTSSSSVTDPQDRVACALLRKNLSGYARA